MCVCGTHQTQQVEEQVSVFPDQVVRLTAQIHKVVEATGRFVSSVDDERHVRGKHKGGAVPARHMTHSHTNHGEKGSQFEQNKQDFYHH